MAAETAMAEEEEIDEVREDETSGFRCNWWIIIKQCQILDFKGFIYFGE